jgi:hypothetical protein
MIPPTLLHNRDWLLECTVFVKIYSSKFDLFDEVQTPFLKCLFKSNGNQFHHVLCQKFICSLTLIRSFTIFMNILIHNGPLITNI